jgi:alkyl hydroperoxide reductase subunit F
MNLQRAKKLVPAAQPGGLIEVELGKWREPEGENRHPLHRRALAADGRAWRGRVSQRGVAYCPHCDGPLFKGKRVAVIGGGNSGVEAAIDLAGIVAHVTLIEFDSQLRADAVLQARLRSLPNVTIIVSALSTEVLGDGEKVIGLRYRDRVTEEENLVDLDGIFVQIGLVPNSEWLDGDIALSPRGEIEVDARGATSVPGVFAAGDATTTPYKQIVIAMGGGATAALSAFDYLIRQPLAEPELEAEVKTSAAA